jgi:hypothetical protein
VPLLLGGPPVRGSVRPFHKISFIVWAALTGVQILAHLGGVRDSYAREYVLALPGAAEIEGHTCAGVPGRSARGAVVIGSVRVGVAVGSVRVGVAVALVALPDFGPCQRYHFGHRHRRPPEFAYVLTRESVRGP